jgi:signal transduction histidine kinase
MTRRIALAILLCACAMLVSGGVVAYAAVRQALLADLDESIIDRASAVLSRALSGQGSATLWRGDSYSFRDSVGQPLSQPPRRLQPADRPTILRQAFVYASDGSRVRRLSLRWHDVGGGEPATMVYTTPTTGFDRTMRELATTLVVVLGIGVTATGAVAGRVSGIALRPLHETAQAIGDIDERRLDRRIDPSVLPRELVPVATRLNEMLERLERAFAQRQQFMIDAAHELRSPVAALRTTLEVALQRPKDAAALTQVLQKCLSSTRMLNRLADLLTEQLRDESPAQADELELCDVANLLREHAEVAEPLALAKQIALVRRFPRELPVTTDPDRLSSIVMNLLSNAIEYTRPGGRVEIECSHEAQHLDLVVRDTGIGIAPEHLPHICEPFYRVDGARRRDGGHLGLGLYLVSSHVQALGGTCEVHSELGRGSAVVVRLPANAASRDALYSGSGNLHLCASHAV